MTSLSKIRKNGFTLIELMIVVVILSLLATIVVPKILNKPEQARRAKAKVDIAAIQNALGLFKVDTGRFPTTAEGLTALVQNPGLKNYDPDGYLAKKPKDPWGRDYVYLCPGAAGRDYDLESHGRDGAPNGNNENADISCWNLEED